MFNSTGNNFGAGTIQFKDYQENNYIVLNAKFTYDPSNTAYQAASVLEIYVPDLQLSRSIESGVFLSFKHSEQSGSSVWVNDGATVLKSWIKDKNTICIEKMTDFDHRTEQTIWIQTLYAIKGKSSSKTFRTKTSVTLTQEQVYMQFSSVVCVIDPHWVFITGNVREGAYAYRNEPWVATFNNFPTDVTSDILVIGGSNQYNPSVDGASFGSIEEGVFSLPSRCNGFDSTGYDPFIFGYYVRES